MRAVLARVSSAQVTVDGAVVGAIDCPETCGILALIGVTHDDGPDACDTMVRKIAELRILPDEKSVTDVGAPVLVVSQFTLYGRTAKGRRPSWSDAAPGNVAEPLVDRIIRGLQTRGIAVSTGVFGAMMQVTSTNEGPFTVIVEC